MAKRTLLEESLLVAEILNKDDRYRMISESIRGTWGSFEDESWSGMGRREGRDILCRQIVSGCLDEPVGLCEDACTSVDKDEVYRLIRSGLQSVVMESVIELEAFYKVCMAIHGRDKEEEEEEPEEQHGCRLAAKQGCSDSSSGSHSHSHYQPHHNHNDDILPETPGQDIWRPLPMEENTNNKKKNTSKEREEEESHGEQKKRGQDEAKMMADEMTRIVDEYFGYKSLVVHLVDLAGFFQDKD